MALIIVSGVFANYRLSTAIIIIGGGDAASLPAPSVAASQSDAAQGVEVPNVTHSNSTPLTNLLPHEDSTNGTTGGTVCTQAGISQGGSVPAGRAATMRGRPVCANPYQVQENDDTLGDQRATANGNTNITRGGMLNCTNTVST